MRAIIVILIFAVVGSCVGSDHKQSSSDGMNKLSELERYVIERKGTEAPFTGIYNDFDVVGDYSCKRCGEELFHSSDKFKSGCGWASFDGEVEGAVERTPDADGIRTEITCAACGAHLGHLFEGEGFTNKNIRHCVNSASMNFTPEIPFEQAIFAGGCFWGVEHLLQQQQGVISVESGYTGGWSENPKYRDVITGETGHAEAVRVTYDPMQVDYETLAKLFFEIHDPTQVDRQGPDVGNQYRSHIFYLNDEQRVIAQQLIDTLKESGYDVATALSPADVFYPAEEYHQDYYKLRGDTPYCHRYTKRF